MTLNDLLTFYLRAPEALGGGIKKAKELAAQIAWRDPAEKVATLWHGLKRSGRSSMLPSIIYGLRSRSILKIRGVLWILRSCLGK
jgi:hypothetical protein